MIKFMLNLRRPNTYAFFCPVSRLHLTVSSPVGFANEVTPAILTALRTKRILDVDGVIDIETGTIKAKQKASAPKENESTQTKAVATATEEKSAEVADEAKADDKTKKNTKKTTKTDAE